MKVLPPIVSLLVAAALLGAAATPLHADEPKEIEPFTLRPVQFLQAWMYEGPIREPEALAVDQKTGEVWIADPRNNVVGAFSAEGMPLFAFSSDKYLRNPRQLAVDDRGRLLVLEQDRTRIRQFNYRGVYLGDLVPPNLGEKPQIAAIAFGPDGSLYVGDNASGEILIYSYPALRLKKRFGSRGEEEGQFRSIAGIAVDEQYIYIVDHVGLAVQLFDHRGDFVRGWGQHAMGGANFSLPRGIAVDAKGRVIVVDGLRHDLKYFNADGLLIGHFGGAGRAPGNTLAPSAVAVGPGGRVYVAERGNARVQVFVEEALPAKPVPARR